MTREKAIRNFERYVNDDCYTIEHREYCRMAIDALREQEKQRWISVDDMLPEKSGTYFVVTKTGAVTYARFYPEHDLKDYKGEVFGHEKGSFQSNRKVLFWMPMPEPPKEGAK